MCVVALINNKGGVGKTTTAIHLAAGAQRQGYDCLLVDLDPQCSASRAIGVPSERPSVASVLFDGFPTEAQVQKPKGMDMDLLAGSSDLQNADIRLSGEYGREAILDEALEGVEYDLIFLDCPPSLSLIPVNAIVAADYFVVPIEPHYLALEGLGSLLSTVDNVEETIGNAAELLGMVITRADFRSNATEETIQVLRKNHGDDVFDTVIRGNVRISEAASFGKTVYDHAPSSTGAEGYRNLTDEFIDRLKRYERHQS